MLKNWFFDCKKETSSKKFWSKVWKQSFIILGAGAGFFLYWAPRSVWKKMQKRKSWQHTICSPLGRITSSRFSTNFLTKKIKWSMLGKKCGQIDILQRFFPHRGKSAITETFQNNFGWPFMSEMQVDKSKLMMNMCRVFCSEVNTFCWSANKRRFYGFFDILWPFLSRFVHF